MYAKCSARCLSHSRYTISIREEPKETEEASWHQKNGGDKEQHSQGPRFLLGSDPVRIWPYRVPPLSWDSGEPLHLVWHKGKHFSPGLASWTQCSHTGSQAQKGPTLGVECPVLSSWKSVEDHSMMWLLSVLQARPKPEQRLLSANPP